MNIELYNNNHTFDTNDLNLESMVCGIKKESDEYIGSKQIQEKTWHPRKGGQKGPSQYIKYGKQMSLTNFRE